ncbi:MAG: amino acid permease [Thiothrix sp.]|nr:amino acid permease [Thiothrix sp.]HPQ94004.1 APC family permease [Thiolinea sp.]
MRNRDGTAIGLMGAMSIGIGGMVGGGIFAVLGEAVTLAHGATALAFLFAGLVALLTSYAYTKLSLRYQSRGGTVSFIDQAFQHNLLSGSMNFLLWLSYLVTIALYAVAFASYAQTFFPALHAAWLKHLFISLAILLPVLINLVSAAIVSRSETVIVLIKLLLLALIIVTSLGFVDTSRLSPSRWGDTVSIIVAGMIIFVAYEGFELIANAAEDISNPEKNLPRAFYGSVVLVIMLYLLIAVITVGVVPESQLAQAKDYALAVAARPALGQLGFTLVSVAALLATFSAINATLYGNARLSFILAREGELPTRLAEQKGDNPVMGVLVTALISLLLANTIDLTEIAIIGSASFLLVFFLVNLGAYRLHKAIHASRLILLIASLASGVALLTLMFHTWSTHRSAVLTFLAFIGASLLFEWGYGRRVRGHFLARPYTPERP